MLKCRELETLIRLTNKTTVTVPQTHITSVITDLDVNLLDELFVLYYKLQNQDMSRGYEVLLERSQSERSIFHQARDLDAELAKGRFSVPHRAQQLPRSMVKLLRDVGCVGKLLLVRPVFEAARTKMHRQA